MGSSNLTLLALSISACDICWLLIRHQAQLPYFLQGKRNIKAAKGKLGTGPTTMKLGQALLFGLVFGDTHESGCNALILFC
jgi:hypothetical protein